MSRLHTWMYRHHKSGWHVCMHPSIVTRLICAIYLRRQLPPVVSLPFVVSYGQIDSAVGVVVILLGLFAFAVAGMNLMSMVVPYCLASLFVLIAQVRSLQRPRLVFTVQQMWSVRKQTVALPAAVAGHRACTCHVCQRVMLLPVRESSVWPSVVWKAWWGPVRSQQQPMGSHRQQRVNPPNIIFCIASACEEAGRIAVCSAAWVMHSWLRSWRWRT